MAEEYTSLKTKDGKPFRMLNLVDFVYIIESATRGLYRGFDRSTTGDNYSPRWLRSDKITRRSPEVWSTKDKTRAMEEIAHVLEYHDAYLVRMLRK